MDKLGQGAGFGHVRQSSQPWQALALACSVKVVPDVVATACADLTGAGAGAGPEPRKLWGTLVDRGTTTAAAADRCPWSFAQSPAPVAGSHPVGRAL
jgi:hypothetical protein